MRQLLQLNKISTAVKSVLKDNYVLSETAENPVGIMLRSFAMHEYTLPDTVVCVGRAGAGVNNIPVDRYADEGVVVFNAPGANANAVKELVITAMLLCGRRIVPAISWAQSLTDGEKTVGQQVEKGKAQFAGTEILGKTLAVYGLGAIGRLSAQAAKALGMNVVGYDPYLSSEARESLIEKGIKIADSVDALLDGCDFITMHVPLTPETREFINKERIATLKKGVNIINLARGELVNNADVIQAVKEGRINRYVTDFPSAELLGVDGIITFPHLGASTEEAEDNCAVLTAEEMLDYIENGNIRNSVNFPAVRLEKEGKARMVVLFDKQAEQDVKAKLGSMKKVINSTVALNKNKGVALVNLSDIPCDNCIGDLKAINGVRKVYFPG